VGEIGRLVKKIKGGKAYVSRQPGRRDGGEAHGGEGLGRKGEGGGAAGGCYAKKRKKLINFQGSRKTANPGGGSQGKGGARVK